MATVSKDLKKAMTAIRTTQQGRRRAYSRFFADYMSRVTEKSIALHKQWYTTTLSTRLEACYLLKLPGNVRRTYNDANARAYLYCTESLSITGIPDLNADHIVNLNLMARSDPHANFRNDPHHSRTVRLTTPRGEIGLLFDTTTPLPYMWRRVNYYDGSIVFSELPAPLQREVLQYAKALYDAYMPEVVEVAKRVFMEKTLWAIYQRWPEAAEAYCVANSIVMPTEENIATDVPVEKNKQLAIATDAPDFASIKRIADAAGLRCSTPVTVVDSKKEV